MYKIILSLLALVLLQPISIVAETLVLKSGKTIEGKLTEKTDKSVTIDFQGVALTYDNAEIERIDPDKEVSPSAATANVGDKIKLRLNLKKGDVYQMRLVIKSKTSQDLVGKNMDINMTMGAGVKMSVEDVDADNNTSMRLTYNWVSVKLKSPMVNMEYDSAVPGANASVNSEMEKSFSLLLGESFVGKYNSSGTMISVSGMDNMLERITKKLNLPEGPQKAKLEEKFRKDQKEGMFKEMMKNMSAALPKDPVAIGDSWTRKDTLPGMGASPLVCETKYTLRDRKNGVAMIDINSNIKPSLVVGAAVPPGFELKGNQQGSIQISEETGLTTKMDMAQKIYGHLKLPPTPEMPAGVSGTMSVDMTMIMTTVKE